MPTASVSVQVAGAGLRINTQLVRSATGQIGHEVPLPAAQAGTLSTRTNDSSGTLTLAGGHTIATSDTVAIGWAGGRRYNVTVGTVSGTSAPFSGGAGDDLPAEDAEITVTPMVAVDTDWDGDRTVLLAVAAAQRVHAHFATDAPAVIAARDLAAGEPWLWATGMGLANPLDSTVVDACLLANLTTSATTATVIAVYDSVE